MLLAALSVVGVGQWVSPRRMDQRKIAKEQASCPLFKSTLTAFRETDPVLYTTLADEIPFYDNRTGIYHVFFLYNFPGINCPWSHIISKDLISWQEVPTALIPSSDPLQPNSGPQFTGSAVYTAHDMMYHIFYTGQTNGNSTEIGLWGPENIVHARSTDSYYYYTPAATAANVIRGDGTIYMRDSDFRDAFVFQTGPGTAHAMILATRTAAGHPVSGIYTSPNANFTTWVPHTPVDSPRPVEVPECPDMFPVGDTWFLISGGYNPLPTTNIRWTKPAPGKSPLDSRWEMCDSPQIDTRHLYAAKRMWDGKRHVLVGWLPDRSCGCDDACGYGTWGGYICTPREGYTVPQLPGQLLFKPVAEAIAAFGPVAPSTCFHVSPTTQQCQGPDDGFMVVVSVSQLCAVGCSVNITLRASSTDLTQGYVLSVWRRFAVLSSPFNSDFRRIRLPDSDGGAYTVRCLVQDTVIECFVNDMYPFSYRVFTFTTGGSVRAEGFGGTQIDTIVFNAPPQPGDRADTVRRMSAMPDDFRRR